MTDAAVMCIASVIQSDTQRFVSVFRMYLISAGMEQSVFIQVLNCRQF